MKSFKQYLEETRGKKKTDDDKYLEAADKQGRPVDEKELEEVNATNDLGAGPHVRRATINVKKKATEKKKTKKQLEKEQCQDMKEAPESNVNRLKLDHREARMLTKIVELSKIAEGTSYNSYKRDESASNRVKFNQSLKRVHENLVEIDNIIENNIKLKTEFNMADPFWKISRGRVAKISEMLNRVNNRLKELSR